MCDPATIAVAALNGLSSVSAINAQNQAHANNRAEALRAQNEQIDDEGRKYVEQNRSLIQGGFDAILQGRAGEAEAFTSAIQNGVQGRSVRSMLSSRGQEIARQAQRSGMERESLETQTNANFKHIRATTQGRINSVSTSSFGLGDVAGVLAPIAKSL